MHEVLVNPLGGLSLPRKSVVRLTHRPDMTLYVYVKQQYNNKNNNNNYSEFQVNIFSRVITDIRKCQSLRTTPPPPTMPRLGQYLDVFFENSQANKIFPKSGPQKVGDLDCAI